MAASRRKKKKATNASLWYSQPLIEELPSFSFGGKGVARQETVVGPHAVPGPGEYDISYNYGEESHTRREHFGISERPPLSTAVYGPGPGTYDHGIRCHGGHEGPGSHFGPHDVSPSLPKWIAQDPPGPGDYNLGSSIGVQVRML
jgi:hypothetical protein